MNRSTAQRKPDKKTKGLGMSPFVSILLSVVFTGLSLLLIVNSVKSVNRAYQRSKLLDQAEEEVQALRLRNLELLRERDNVSDGAYVEEQARDRLLYTKDGEVLLVLPESIESESEDTGEEEEVLGEEDVIEEREKGWERWWSVLRDGV